MVVDYSQTVNKYTSHDAYPLPNIDKQVSEIAKRTIFSIFDLKPAYYQVPRCAADCSDIAFETNRNKKNQYTRFPFGNTNEVSFISV